MSSPSAFVAENTEPDGLFLTATKHTNPVAVLAGRSVTCGPGLYLFFHGVDYQTREKQVSRAYGGGEDFLRLKDELGVDYVYIGENERNAYERLIPSENRFGIRVELDSEFDFFFCKHFTSLILNA